MPARFCSACGAKAPSGGRFCAECGASLTGRAAGGARQLTLAGIAALAVFLAAGLTIWTFILSPSTPRPLPSAGAPRTAAAPPAGGGTANAALPEGHPQIPMELPAEVKKFIADLAAKAKDKPQDTEAWLKLANVNARAAQIDSSFGNDAIAAFQHVLELDSKNPEALRGLANMYYDRDQSREAIPFFERYLALRPDDDSARTDLGTMYLYSGDPTRAVATYQAVIKRSPTFLQAHYNLAVTYHRQGDDDAALKELGVARGLATDEGARKQIDDLVASLKGEPAPATTSSGPPAPGGGAPASPFQAAVESAFREHPIMGPRIVGFQWTAPASGKVLVRDFPMDGMPPAVREKFAAHLAEQIRSAQQSNGIEGPVRVDIADAGSGTVMATVTP